MTENYVVRTASKICLPGNHKAFFSKPERLNPIAIFYAMRACVALTHTLQMAKAPTTSKDVYDLSLSMVRRSITSLPFHKEIAHSAAWINGLCEDFYDVAVPQALYQPTELESTSVRSCALLVDGMAHAETLTAEMGAILYDLPEAAICETFRLCDSTFDEISSAYFAFLDYALSDFKEAMLQEAPRLVAYPFAIPAVEAEGAGLSFSDLFDDYDFEDAPQEVGEIVCTSYVPAIHLYMVWDALYEKFEHLVWEDGAFSPLGKKALQSEELNPEDHGMSPIETENAQYFKLLLDLAVEESTEKRQMPMDEFLKAIEEEGEAAEAEDLDALLKDLFGDGDSFDSNAEGFTDADWEKAMDDDVADVADEEDDGDEKGDD